SDHASPETYTLSLHDALPIWWQFDWPWFGRDSNPIQLLQDVLSASDENGSLADKLMCAGAGGTVQRTRHGEDGSPLVGGMAGGRSGEPTAELPSPTQPVFRLL